MSWSEDATTAVVSLAATGRQFTVDEVWWWLDQRSTSPAPEDAKALGGVITTLSRRLGVIEPHYSWMTSVRKNDRPIRVWTGTEIPHPSIIPSEDDLMIALEAVEAVGRERARLMRAQVRAQIAAV